MLSPFKKATSRRQMLQTSAAVLAAPWIASHAASPVADGRTITLVVSYPAGGGADLIARLIAPKMATALGQSVVVDNKPGASGQLAAAHVARSNPDGSTLLLDASSFAVNPSLFSKLPYDPVRSFRPVTNFLGGTMVYAAGPAAPGSCGVSLRTARPWAASSGALG